MSKKMSVSKYLPIVVGSLLAIFIVTYDYAHSNAVNQLVPPSSTAALNHVFLPIFMLVVYGIGYVGGLLLRLVYRKLGGPEHVSAGKVMGTSAALLLAVAGLSYYQGLSQGNAFAALYQPRIMFTTDSLQRESFQYVPTHSDAISNERSAPAREFVWNAEQAQWTVEANTRLIINTPRLPHPILYSTDISYISSVNVQRVVWGESEHLAVLLSLRPTSQRSVLAVFNPEGQLVYEEMLKRCLRKEQQLLTVLMAEGHEALLVNHCDAFTLSFRGATNHNHAS